MVKKRASKYVSKAEIRDLTVTNRSITAVVTRRDEVTSSLFAAPIARGVRQRTRRSKDSPSATWLKVLLFVRLASLSGYLQP